MITPSNPPRERNPRTATSRAGSSPLRLALVAGYGFVLLSVEALHLERTADVALLLVAAALWFVVLGVVWRGLARSADRGRHAVEHLGLLLLLVVPLLLGRDVPWLVFLLVVTAYVLELRNVAAGRALPFSFGLIVFVGLAAGLAMVQVEKSAPNAQITTAGDASTWILGSLLRVDSGRLLRPVTDDGRLLTAVISVAAILATSMFTAQVVTWVVGSRDDETGSSAAAAGSATVDQRPAAGDDVVAEIRRLRESLDALTARLDEGAVVATEGRRRGGDGAPGPRPTAADSPDGS